MRNALAVKKIYDLDQLLDEFRRRARPEPGRLVALHGLEGMDGYNPSESIPNGRFPYVFVRAEPRDVEYDSWSVPFRMVSADCWEVEEHLPMYRLEDPCASVIHGTLVVGGVRIVSRVGNRPTWETVFLRGESPADLEEFARSPAYMKDVRLVELEDGGVGVFTRPWGGPTSSRHMGYTELYSLDDLTTPVMANAPLLTTQPVDGQWWGANAVYNLGDGNLGVLAHFATWKAGSRHYYPITFVFDRLRRKIVQGPEIVADRSCFPEYAAREPDLQDVIFPGWLDREHNLLYAGLSDTAIGVMPLEDPFRSFRREGRANVE